MSRKAWEPKSGLVQPGEDSDRAVAEAHGVSRIMVFSWRKRHGVKAGGKMGRPVGTRWEPDPRFLQPGEASDHEVAEAQKVSRNTVFRWRRRNNVEA
jgi:transposase-like protein